MIKPKTHLYYLLLLVCIIVTSPACRASLTTTSQEYSGVIYYQDRNGIWKVGARDKQALLLASEVTDSFMYLSPDQKWLSYIVYTFEDERKLLSLWVASTRDPFSMQVSNKVPSLKSDWLENGVLLYTEYPDFYIDYDVGQAKFGDGITRTFDPETSEHQLTPQLQPKVLDPSKCRPWLAPAGYDDMAETCRYMPNGDLLRVVDIDGSNPITVATPYRRGGIDWSSDGDKLAFANLNDSLGIQHLFVWNRWDGSIQQITKRDLQREYDFIALSWSPDSQWISFHNGGNGLCVIRVEDGEITCFEGYVSAFGTKPAWSPDSRAIVLSSNRIGRLLMGDTDLIWDLFIISIPDGNVVRVTDSPEMESEPVWGW
ncbi:MAG: hypothetical protein GY833_24725 [Aestuariibacter sp.]|nr:hypothetical protein [Aestuariibacter sp.]